MLAMGGCLHEFGDVVDYGAGDGEEKEFRINYMKVKSKAIVSSRDMVLGI